MSLARRLATGSRRAGSLAKSLSCVVSGWAGHQAAPLSPLAGQGEGGEGPGTVLAAAAAVIALGATTAACEQQQSSASAAAQQSSSSSNSSWVPSWLAFWRSAPSPPNPYLQAISEDPRAAVVLAYALPYLSVAFGYSPSQQEMAEAARLVEPSLPSLAPWEVTVLAWGGARLGWAPTPSQAAALQARVAALAAAQPGSPGALTAQEAAMLAWALSVQQLLTPALWAALVAYLARCGPPSQMDEVVCVHLFQAAMFADRSAVTSHLLPAANLPHAAPAGPILPRLRSAADEVRATLAAGGCPLPLIERCTQVYKESARHPGFDGPLVLELTLLKTLVGIYQSIGDDRAYQDAFHDLKLVDIGRAQQLLSDPFMLEKYKREIQERRERQNQFTRQLGDVSRTLRDLGLYHVTQAAVEDGLVHVDVALPDFKIALFLETGAAPSPTSGAPRGGAAAGLSSASEGLGTALSGYASNETPGTRAAKLRLLQQLGWKVLPLTWIAESSRGGEAAKRALLLKQLEGVGSEQLMRGRVSTMLHGAMRSAEESKLGAERYGSSSAGHYITRQQQQQQR